MAIATSLLKRGPGVSALAGKPILNQPLQTPVTTPPASVPGGSTSKTEPAPFAPNPAIAALQAQLAQQYQQTPAPVQPQPVAPRPMPQFLPPQAPPPVQTTQPVFDESSLRAAGAAGYNAPTPRPTFDDSRVRSSLESLAPSNIPAFDDSRYRASAAALSAPSTVRPVDYSGIETQQQALLARLNDLLAGRGIDVGDVSADPEARAYRVAAEREAARARESEADRLAASGVTNSGDFDTRVAGIREATGERIASNEAAIAGRRRAEAQSGAIAGAQLSLSDLDRRAGLERSRFDTEFARERAGRSDLSERLNQELAAARAKFDSDFSRDRASRADRSERVGRELETERARFDSEFARDRAEQSDLSDRLNRELEIARTGYGAQVDASDRAFRDRRAGVEDEFRTATARYNADRDAFDSTLRIADANTAAGQERARLQALLLELQLQDEARRESLELDRPGRELANTGTALQNALLKQEVLKGKKSPSIGGMAARAGRVGRG